MPKNGVPWPVAVGIAVLAGLVARKQEHPVTVHVPEAGLNLADELRVAEYQALRAEVTQSLSAQQQTLQWSLAAFAALFVAGFVLAGQQGVDVRSGTAGTLFLLMFGLALPGIAVGACLAWFGELIRCERAGRFLRGYEQHVAQQLRRQGVHEAPLFWETLTAAEAHARTGLGRGKQQVGYLGSLLLYVGTLAASEIIFVVALRAHRWAESTPAFVDDVLYVAALATFVGLFVTAVRLVRILQAMGREAAPLRSTSPADQVYPLGA